MCERCGTAERYSVKGGILAAGTRLGDTMQDQIVFISAVGHKAKADGYAAVNLYATTEGGAFVFSLPYDAARAMYRMLGDELDYVDPGTDATDPRS